MSGGKATEEEVKEELDLGLTAGLEDFLDVEKLKLQPQLRCASAIIKLQHQKQIIWYIFRSSGWSSVVDFSAHDQV